MSSLPTAEKIQFGVQMINRFLAAAALTTMVVLAASPAAHAQISAAIGEDDPDYHVRSHPGGMQLRNPRPI